MSDLTTFRDHCRAMANPSKPEDTQLGGWCQAFGPQMPIDHERCEAGWCACDCHPHNAPPSDADRALWTRLADEVDAYLGSDDEPLWGVS